jgi:hypothetical protein
VTERVEAAEPQGLRAIRRLITDDEMPPVRELFRE